MGLGGVELGGVVWGVGWGVTGGVPQYFLLTSVPVLVGACCWNYFIILLTVNTINSSTTVLFIILVVLTLSYCLYHCSSRILHRPVF